MDRLIPDRKNTIIIAFDKPISKKLSPNSRTENMVSSDPLSFAMKYRFKTIVVKFFVRKTLEDFYFPNAFIVITESF